MSHFIEKCKLCKDVISQCRCAGEKIERWSICDECEGHVEIGKNLMEENKAMKEGFKAICREVDIRFKEGTAFGREVMKIAKRFIDEDT